VSGTEDDLSGRVVSMTKNCETSDDGSRELVDNSLPRCEESSCWSEVNELETKALMVSSSIKKFMFTFAKEESDNIRALFYSINLTLLFVSSAFDCSEYYLPLDSHLNSVILTCFSYLSR